MSEFKKFITQFRCKTGESYTHTSIDDPKGSFKIPEESINEFYNVYNRSMMQGTMLYMTEKPTDPSPMRLDLDFRFSIEKDDDGEIIRKYNESHIITILNTYNSLLEKYIDINKFGREWKAYVMEKLKPVENRGKCKDGIHIIWPNVILSHSMQHLIRKHILNVANEMFKGLSMSNTFEDIIDKAIIDKNNWQMYGSRKPDCESYRVTKVYAYTCAAGAAGGASGSAGGASGSAGAAGGASGSAGSAGGASGSAGAAGAGGAGGVLELCITPAPSEELEFPLLFSMRNKGNHVTPILPEKDVELEEYIRHIVPTMDDKRKSKLDFYIFGKSQNNSRNLTNDEDFNMAKQLVEECLVPTRAENYEDWIKLGWTLRNIDFRLLDTWINFSRVSNKYVEGECQKMWNRMKSDTLGMGTLRWWTRNDNPKQYEAILRNNVEILIDKCIGSDGAHYDIATVIHTIYKDRYRFTSKDTWYMFADEKHKWVRSKEGLKLRNILSTDICSRFMRRSMYWTEKARGAEDDESREKCESKSKKLLTISVKLKTAGYKDSVLKECKELFTDENFEELLDSHAHLLGFENGVYDLRMGEFRDGLPDDYISFSTNRHYVDFDKNSEEAKEIEKYLSQVFVNENVRKYMKDIMACMIDGGIRQEKFYIYTGNGCHAKNTEIIMYDGTKKLVQDITESDILMGDDSTPRNIIQLFRGKSKMYRIIPKKGDSFVVNEDHKISLKVTLSSCPRITTTSKEYRVKWLENIFKTEADGCIAAAKEKCFQEEEECIKYIEYLKTNKNVLQMDDVIDVQVKNYINFNMKNLNLYLFKVAVNYAEQEIALDPYMLGCWLGDGHSRNTRITTMDSEIVEYFSTHLPPNHDFHMVSSKDNGKAKTYNITFTGKKRKYISDNEILNGLRKYNLIMNKHIPIEYKVNSRETRLKLLAGIIDTDGTYQKNMKQYTVSQKNEKLIDDIIDLARSLGFACYKKQFQGKCHNNGVIGTYYRINIAGKGIEEIPCLLPRKKADERIKLKDVLLNNFDIENVPDDDYYGFEVSNNHRYLMGDYTVTCNSNSKSALLNLVQKAIGDYYCILPIALLTQKRAASNSAQSELERTKGRRIAVMQEPGENEKLNIGLMKELSGGDRIMTRALFKEPIEFRPQFKMIMTCNELPEVPSDDGGTWRRIRVIEYKSKFTDSPDPNNPFEFPLDGELLDKFEKWADIFISMLIHHHGTMDFKKIHEPEEVRLATEGYKKNNDLIGQYINERLEKDEESKDRVIVTKLYGDFRGWAFNIVPKGKLPDRNQFRANVEKVFGVYPTNGKGWKGIVYKSSGGENNNSDVD